MKYVLSYGGGIDSTALMIWLIKNKKPLDYVVFADTGNEIPDTYEYLKTTESYLNKTDVQLKIVYPFKKRSLFTRCFQRKIIPSQLWRWCTRDVKVKPIHKFYKLLNDSITQYMGIDYDEFYRMKPSGESWIKNEYPLVDNKLGREDCINIIKNEGLPVPKKSGCFFCPFNNKARWNEIKTNYPALYQLSVDLEQNNKYYPKQKLIQIQSDLQCDGYCMT